MHDIGDALMRNGLSEPVLSMEHITLTFDDCWQLMRELKNIGAGNINHGRTRALTGKNKLKKMMQCYEQYRLDNKLPATYEVIYGHAWATEGLSNAGELRQTISLQSLKQNLQKRKQR